LPQNKGYDWCDVDNPPLIEEHSVAKHQVLQFYLERYMKVMAANPRRDYVKIHLIDGFAGGGKYRHEKTGLLHDGSPLIFLKTIESSEKEIQATRKKPFHIDAHYYFVEKQAKFFKFLQETLVKENYKNEIDKTITLVKGTFVDVLPKLLSNIKSSSRKPRSIFLLDQYGYRDVPFQTLQLIFKTLPNTAEVLLTYAHDALINYMANTQEFKQILENCALTDVITEKVIKNFRESPKSETKESRLVIEQLLAYNIFKKSGASYFTPFFITSPKSSRSYLLLHLSNHVKARDEMNKVHWELKNHFHHYGNPGLNNNMLMLGVNPKKDIGEQILLDYCFDDDAEKRTYNALLEEIPRIITLKECITFNSLLIETCNNTPANSKHYKEILARLVAEKMITIISEDGKQHSTANTIKNDDRIIPAKQRNLF
jgi:three-Cys-motif partner protein